MKSYLKMIGLFILLIAIHQGLALLYLIPFATFYQLIGLEGEQLEQLIYAQGIYAIIFSGIGALVIFSLMFKNKRENLMTRSRFNPISFKQIGWSAAIGFSFVFFSQLIVEMMSHLFPIQYERFLESMDVIVDAPWIAVILAVVIVAPLFEEIMFRGIIYDSLQKRMNIYLSVVIAGLFFGVYHLNIFQGTYATLIGIVMGLSLVWTKSIWAPIIIHFVNNLISVLISYTAIGNWFNLDQIIPVILSFVIILTILPYSIYKLYLTTKKPIDEHLNLELELD